MKLQERTPSIHMHALDLRNHGSSPHTEEMDWDTMTLDIREYINREGLVNPKPILLGHSLGGRVAMQVALKHSDLLAGAIIVDVAPRPPPHPSVGPPVQLRLLDTMAAMRMSINDPYLTNASVQHSAKSSRVERPRRTWRSACLTR